jgi:phenylpropionate dioxygenase-like ring-hydroxylating dioxygenase large terminal subunit
MSDTRARSKAPGDFVATRIGRKPLLLVRDADGKIQLLHNQCAHRGSMVVASEAGHSHELRCCYHGWTYHLDGRLKAAPLLHGYPPHFDPKSPEFAMRRVPRVASYRGFVFASLAKDGESLEDFLGYMTTSFDDMVDRAPDDGLGRGRRRVQAHLQGQLEAIPGESLRRGASAVHASILDRRRPAAIR